MKKHSLLKFGLIPAGTTCPFTDDCAPFHESARNGAGCPVGPGRTSEIDFSCGLARGYNIVHECKRKKQGGK